MDDPDEGGGRRKVYRITDRGRKVMEEELRRLSEILRFARAASLLPKELMTPEETG